MLLGAALLSGTAVVEVGLSPSRAFEGWQRWVYFAQSGIVFCLARGAGLLGTLTFPAAPRPVWDQRHRRVAVVLAPVAVAGLGYVPVALTATSFTGFMHGAVLVQTALSLLVILAILVIVGVRFHRYRTTGADPVGRQQLLWTGGSFVVAALIVMAFWFVARLFVGHALLPEEWIGGPGLVFVFGFAVAMLRFRLFGLDSGAPGHPGHPCQDHRPCDGLTSSMAA